MKASVERSVDKDTIEGIKDQFEKIIKKIEAFHLHINKKYPDQQVDAYHTEEARYLEFNGQEELITKAINAQDRKETLKARIDRDLNGQKLDNKTRGFLRKKVLEDVGTFFKDINNVLDISLELSVKKCHEMLEPAHNKLEDCIAICDSYKSAHKVQFFSKESSDRDALQTMCVELSKISETIKKQLPIEKDNQPETSVKIFN